MLRDNSILPFISFKHQIWPSHAASLPKGLTWYLELYLQEKRDKQREADEARASKRRALREKKKVSFLTFDCTLILFLICSDIFVDMESDKKIERASVLLGSARVCPTMWCVKSQYQIHCLLTSIHQLCSASQMSDLILASWSTSHAAKKGRKHYGDCAGYICSQYRFSRREIAAGQQDWGLARYRLNLKCHVREEIVYFCRVWFYNL